MAFMFLVVVVGDAGAVIDAATAGNGTGLKQKGIGQRSLTGRTVAYQRDVANVPHRMFGWHRLLQEPVGWVEPRSGDAHRSRSLGKWRAFAAPRLNPPYRLFIDFTVAITSERLNAPSYNARPMTQPATPSSPRSRTFSRLVIPPEANTGTGTAASISR